MTSTLLWCGTVLCYRCYPVFGKFINFGPGTVMGERVKSDKLLERKKELFKIKYI